MGEIAQKIYKTLNDNGQGHHAQEMIDEYGIGGTPGEMFEIVCYWLAKMRNRYSPAFDLVRKDAETLFEIGYRLNYFSENALNKL
jgi:hypothetical protein